MATFSARARAVDMLGRQQIAGIPTAISELFKNAHDAYADHVAVDFFRSDALLVLRDDGLGMTSEEFEDRWLSLGTESKLAAGVGLDPAPTDPTKPLRAVLGEKGIGRLAIAAIGPQVLVLTRPKLDRRGDLVAALINWGMFTLPGVNLDQIIVPLRRFRAGTLPTARDVKSMAADVRKNLTALRRFAKPEQFQAISRQLHQFAVDPIEMDRILGGPSLTNKGHGTQFFIQPAEEALFSAIDGPRNDDDAAPPLLKALVGFTNTMTPRHARPVIAAAFRDHKTDEAFDDLIDEHEFFGPEEFENADHHIEGQFDAFGQFAGTVTVYGEPSAGHVVPWPASGQQTDCGPFHLNLAVVQGAARESTMPMEEWLRITRKLNRYGGLYIYRDGVRVLPYGNNDYDFLDIERNRTKSARYYYFSYRRIFGVVEISREQNPELQEKAGREGFRENKAYRQFQDILKNFFVQIAADFFREGGSRADRFVERKAELDRLERARREREKRVTARRNAFRDNLEQVLKYIGEGQPERDTHRVLQRIRDDSAAALLLPEPSAVATALLDLESSARRELASIRERYRVVAPRGVGLSLAVRRDYDAYQNEYAGLVDRVFDPLREQADSFLNAVSRNAHAAVDRRLRFDRAIQELSEQAQRAAHTDSQAVRGTISDVNSRAAEVIREAVASVDSAIKQALSEAAKVDVSKLSDDEFVARRRHLEMEIDTAAERQRRVLGSIADQLNAVVWPSRDGEDVVTHVDMTEALEDEVLALRERAELDLELAQLGMAVQVVNHEFDASIRSVRRHLRELRAWADANTDLQPLYDSIRNSFDHLDGYLTLFTPMQRRLNRKATTITGGEIAKFLQDLFDERLRRHSVELDVTTSFRRFSIRGHPSAFFPVFVNLVDNALFWLRDSAQPRVIRLDARGDALIISNTGPAISTRDRDRIFEMGFSRKPGGRGMGLYISRHALAKEGYALDVVEPQEGFGVTFRIAHTNVPRPAAEQP